MVSRIIILLLLIVSTAKASTNLWSAEWTNGTQTNAYYVPEPKHYIELIHAINERITAQSVYADMGWWYGVTSTGDDLENQDHLGAGGILINTNGADFSGWTNEYWSPSQSLCTKMRERITQLTEGFVASNEDYSAWLNTDIMGINETNWFYPALAHKQDYWLNNTNVAYTNYTRYPMGFRTYNGTTFFTNTHTTNIGGLQLFNSNPNKLSNTVFIVKNPVREDTGTHILREYTLRPGPPPLGFYRYSNDVSRYSASIWDYTGIVVKADTESGVFKTNSQMTPSKLGKMDLEIMYVTATNTATGLYREEEGTTNSLVVSTNYITESLPYYFPAGGTELFGSTNTWIVDIKVVTTNSANLFLSSSNDKMVSMFLGAMQYGSESDWYMSWLEMVEMREQLRRMKYIPSILEGYQDGYMTATGAATSTTADGWDCDNIPTAIESPGAWTNTYEDGPWPRYSAGGSEEGKMNPYGGYEHYVTAFNSSAGEDMCTNIVKESVKKVPNITWCKNINALPPTNGFPNPSAISAVTYIIIAPFVPVYTGGTETNYIDTKFQVLGTNTTTVITVTNTTTNILVLTESSTDRMKDWADNMFSELSMAECYTNSFPFCLSRADRILSTVWAMGVFEMEYDYP